MTDDVDHLNRLGGEALAAGRPAEAVRLFGQAILQAPRDAASHANMAAAYLAQGRSTEALAHAERAVALAPDLAVAHHNLGNAHFVQGDPARALAAFRTARDLDPDSEAHWTNFLFAQIFTDEAGNAALFAENRAWGERVERRVGVPPRPRPADADPERPLRLAYVMPELDTHVTPRFVAAMLAYHNPQRFAVTIYGDRADGGPRPASLTHPDIGWVDTRGLDPAALAARLRNDRIDVLIHPCTFKARYRLVLAHRAAPLQIAGVNLVSTTGLGATDALVGDGVITPPEDAPFFTERLMRLPVFNTYRAPQDAPDVAALPAMHAGFVTFGSFNNPAKISERSLAAWSHVLRRVPRSRILFKHRAFDDPAIRERWRARFGLAEDGGERIAFAGFTADPHAYLSAYNDVDVALDPMPFSGGTTSYEAIWMGVPVLTCVGASAMARQTGSLMRAVGHPEFVSTGDEDYVRRAVELAADPVGLAAIRVGLRQRARGTIFDAARYTAALEAAIRDLWRELCRSGFA